MIRFRNAIAAFLFIILCISLAGCNGNKTEVYQKLNQAVLATCSVNAYSASFTVTSRSLVLYSEKQKASQKQRYDNGDTAFCFSDDPVINYNKAVNRTNWEDADNTEWVETQYRYQIKWENKLYVTRQEIMYPPEKDSLTGETLAPASTVLYNETTETVDESSINLLATVLADYQKDDIGGNTECKSVRWFSKEIIRIETEKVLLFGGGEAVFDEEDNSYKDNEGIMIKNNEGVYNWTVNGEEIIDRIVTERIDFTLKSGKVQEIEYYSEEIRYLDCDKRNYAKGGKISTDKKAILTGCVEYKIQINFS